VAAIEKGFFQREIADSAYRYQKEIENKKRIVVGVNEYEEEEEKVEIPILKIDPEVEKKQVARLKALRQRRDNNAVKKALEEVEEAARDRSKNIMEPILKATRAYATLGEIVDAMKQVFGEYREPPIF